MTRSRSRKSRRVCFRPSRKRAWTTARPGTRPTLAPVTTPPRTTARAAPRAAAFRTRCSIRSWPGSPLWPTASANTTAPCTPRPALREDLGQEPDAEDAAKYYGGQVKSLRFRCRAAMIVCIPLIYISLGLPVFGVLKSSPSVAALVCLMMQLTVMLIGLDVITNGFFNLVRRTPGLESLVFLNCVFSALDAVVLAVTGSDAVGLPFCAVSAFAVACCLWSALNTCRGFKSTFRTLAVDKDPFTVSADSEVVKDSITVLKSKRDTAGFIHRSEEAGPADTIYASLRAVSDRRVRDPRPAGHDPQRQLCQHPARVCRRHRGRARRLRRLWRSPSSSGPPRASSPAPAAPSRAGAARATSAAAST